MTRVLLKCTMGLLVCQIDINSILYPLICILCILVYHFHFVLFLFLLFTSNALWLHVKYMVFTQVALKL